MWFRRYARGQTDRQTTMAATGSGRDPRRVIGRSKCHSCGASVAYIDAVAAGTGVQYYFSPCLSLDRTTAVDRWVQTLRSVTHRTLHCWTSLFQTDILQLLSYSSQWVIGHSPHWTITRPPIGHVSSPYLPLEGDSLPLPERSSCPTAS